MHKIKVRWVIQKDERIFLVRETTHHFLYLPGGTLDDDETLKECLEREIFEELWVKPVIGDLISIREFWGQFWLQIDVWLEILNTSDFEDLDTSKATHSFENYDERFYTFEELQGQNIKPHNLIERLKHKGKIEIIEERNF